MGIEISLSGLLDLNSESSVYPQWVSVVILSVSIMVLPSVGILDYLGGSIIDVLGGLLFNALGGMYVNRDLC